MFGLEPAELIAVAGFALSTLGALWRLSIQCSRILSRITSIEHRLHDHEMRIRHFEGRRVMLPEGYRG